MGRWRHVVEVGALLLCASVLGCESSPSGSVRPSPAPTLPRLVAATATAAAPRPVNESKPWAVSPTDTPAPARTIVAVPTAPPPAIPPPAAGVPPTRDAGSTGGNAGVPAAPYAGIPTAQPPPPRPARAFRTPERANDQVFVAPQGGTAETDTAAETGATGMGTGAGPRATSAVVSFRATATQSLAGFGVRAAYAQSFGHFVSLGGGAGADCSGAAGAIITANDTGKGELILIVATAQTLSFPFDVFCRFTVTAGERLDASAFQPLVTEVTLAAGTRGDPAVLSLSVSVR